MNTLALFGTLQMPELIIILVVVLLLFGPKALPKLARSLGSSMREFKDATTKMSESVLADDEDEERERVAKQRPREVEARTPVASKVAEAEAEKVTHPS